MLMVRSIHRQIKLSFALGLCKSLRRLLHTTAPDAMDLSPFFRVKLRKRDDDGPLGAYFFSPGLGAARILSPSFNRFDTTRKGPETTSAESARPETISMLS